MVAALTEPMTDGTSTFGATLRSLRQARAVRLSELAQGVGRSIGWLSQVERGISVPTAADVRLLAGRLGVDVCQFYAAVSADLAAPGPVLRSADRTALPLDAAGLSQDYLYSDAEGACDILRTVVPPGSESAFSEAGVTQVCHVVSGRLQVWVCGAIHAVGPGDTFRIRPGEPVRWLNCHDVPCALLRVLVPAGTSGGGQG